MPDSIFTKIVNRQIPARRAQANDDSIAINATNPPAPVHLLVAPTRPIATLNDSSEGDRELVGGMFLVAAKLMKQMGHSDYRTVFNCGEGAGQTVFHIHLHVLAGRELGWPPG